MRILGLTTCHNRRETTLRALSSLEGQILPENTYLHVCIVDDASDDNTASAVRSAFPEVTIVHGTGDLFWAGGMRFGWQQYAVSADFDYLLAFNDDVELFPDALQRLLTTAAVVEDDGCTAHSVSGALMDPDTGRTTYGGVVRRSWWHPLRFERLDPQDRPLECSTLNMNCALISRHALSLTGFLASEFKHKRADYDFGLRLRDLDGRVVLAPGYVGKCRRNNSNDQPEPTDVAFSEAWRQLTGVKKQPPRERATFFRRHAGRLWPIYWILPYLRIALVHAWHSLRRGWKS